MATIRYHTCGDCPAYIPDFIEMGIDILGPVQIGTLGMDPHKLKDKRAQEIAYCAGESTRSTSCPLPPPTRCGSRSENVEIFKPGGGYVFNKVRNIQVGVSPKNVVAMYEAAYKSGFYH